MNSKNFNPDELLRNIDKSILAKGIIIAVIVHAIVLFGTSLGLYKDWVAYRDKEPVGLFKKPSTIKNIKKQEQLEAEKARREAEIQRKAEDAAMAASNAAPASAEAKAAPPAGSASAAAEAEGAKKPPEVEPLPPASGDIDLGDLGF